MTASGRWKHSVWQTVMHGEFMLWEVRMTTVRKICSIMNAMEDTNWLSVLLAAQLYDAAGFS